MGDVASTICKSTILPIYFLAKFGAVLLVTLLCISVVISVDNGCPISSKMISCSPKCKDDSECHGRKCCPNICSTKSCVPDHLKDSNNDGYKNQNSKAGTGSYCGNVKCNSYEKCELDRTTKRQKCVRN